MKKIIIIVLFVVAIAFSWYYYRQFDTERSADTLFLNGNIDIREVDLSFRVGGRLLSLTEDEGAVLQAGQVVGKIDPEPYEIALREAECARNALAESLKRLEMGNRKEEIAVAKATLEAQKVILSNAERTYKRYQDLIRTKTVSQQDLDNAKAACEKAQADEEARAEEYKLMLAGAREEDIAQVRAQVAQADARIEKCKLDLKDTELICPSDGVLLTRSVEPGTMLAMGSPVLTLSLTKPVWVRAYVEEPDLGKITTGMKVVIVSDDGRRIPGIIGFISPKTEFTPKTVESKYLRTSFVYRLRIIADASASGLNQGMPVTVEVNY